MAFIIRKT